MDKWLGSGVKLLDLAQDLVQAPTDAPLVTADGIKELRFGQGQLGFTIECMHVASVQKDTQAARSGVEVGDRLLKVDGRAVPEFEPDDAEAEQKAQDLVSKWLEDMPRPGMITFLAPSKDKDASGIEEESCIDQPVIIDEDVEVERDTSLMDAQTGSGVYATTNDQPNLDAYDGDLLAELNRERAEKLQLVEELKEQRGKVTKLWKQLAELKAENKQILAVQSRAEAESADALDGAQKREQALKEEVAALQQALADTTAKSAALTEASLADLEENLRYARMESKEFALKASSAESRATAVETEAETLRRVVAGLQAENEILVRNEREKLDRWEKESLEKFQAQEREHHQKQAETSKLLEQARKEAAGDLDFAADVPSDMPVRSKNDSKEVAALYDRIDLLQKRCGQMQKRLKKLESKGLEVSAPFWAPKLVAIVGLRAGEPLLQLYTTLSVATVRATNYLLEHEFWRWLFYFHIVVLYTIAASWYSQRWVDPAQPTDELNAVLKKINAAAAAAATVATTTLSPTTLNPDS